MIIQESRDLFLSRLSANKRKPEQQTHELISIECEQATSSSQTRNSSDRLLRSIRERVKQRNSKKRTEIKEYLAAICSFTEHQVKFEVNEKASMQRVLEANFKKRDAVKRRKDLMSLAINPLVDELKVEVSPSISHITQLRHASKDIPDESVDSTRQSSTGKKASDSTVKFPSSLRVVINGRSASLQTDQINLLQLIGEVNAMMDKLWKMLGAQPSKIYDLFCLSVSKKNIIWEVMFDASHQPKKVGSLTELLVMFLRYGLKVSRTSGVPRPLYLNPQVCAAISREFRPGHQAAQTVLNRVLAALEPNRLKSTQLTIRGLNSTSIITDRPALSRTTSIQLVRNDSRLLTAPALEIPESLRVDQVLTAQEVVEVFAFLEAGKHIVADLKAEHYQASFRQVAAGIDKLGETRHRISENLQSVQKVWLRPFKADSKDHLPVRLVAVKPAAEDETAAKNDGFIDPGLVANNELLRGFASSLEVNTDYSPALDILRFIGSNPAINR